MQGSVRKARCRKFEQNYIHRWQIFHHPRSTNAQKDRILANSPSEVPKKFRYVSRVQKTQIVMFWASICKMCRTLLMFIPQAAKINSINYQELVLERVLNNAGQELFESGTFIIQQDAAPAHNSKATQSWLRQIIRVLIPRKNGRPIVQIQPHGLFCVVNSSDESVFWFSQKYQSSETETLSGMGDSSPRNPLCAIEALADRIKRVIQNNGGYIE